MSRGRVGACGKEGVVRSDAVRARHGWVIGIGGVGDRRLRQCRARGQRRCVWFERERARGERMARVPLLNAVEVLQSVAEGRVDVVVVLV